MIGRDARFAPGQAVMYRGVDERKRVISVIPVRVVRDDNELVVLWMPVGVSTMKPELVEHTPGTPRRWIDGNWYLTRSTWRWAELLILVRPDERRATWVRWSADRTFRGWAVNLQDELFRTRLGFDIYDHQLDVLIEPDGRWRYKDEAELALSVELGRMTRDAADEVRAEARLAIGQIERNESPFCDGWERWTPDPTWTLPDLVDDWDDVSMYQQLEESP